MTSIHTEAEITFWCARCQHPAHWDVERLPFSQVMQFDVRCHGASVLIDDDGIRPFWRLVFQESAPGGSGQLTKEKTEMSTFMRAKMQVKEVTRTGWPDADGYKHQDRIKCTAVGRSGGYPADGGDENNTFAKFTPAGECELTISNPDLVGKIVPGQEFYLDFTLVK